MPLPIVLKPLFFYRCVTNITTAHREIVRVCHPRRLCATSFIWKSYRCHTSMFIVKRSKWFDFDLQRTNNLMTCCKSLDLEPLSVRGRSLPLTNLIDTLADSNESELVKISPGQLFSVRLALQELLENACTLHVPPCSFMLLKDIVNQL